jgi:predicted ester cyclase
MVSGRNILAVLLATGTQSGPMQTPMGEMPASNKKMGMLMFHRLQIDDANKATDEWAYADAATMMAQLGTAPKGAPPTRPVMDKGMEGAPVVVVTQDNDQEKANLETAKKYNAAFVDNKPADLTALLTEDSVESDMTSEKDVSGVKNVQKGMKEFRDAWSDVKMSDVNMWAAGDYVIDTFKFEGKNDKKLGKMKPTGKTVSLDGAEVIHFKDGKIDHVWRFMNGVDFAMQMGMMPAAAPAGAQGSAAGSAAAAPETK